MRVFFVASECAPIAKVGGLADVVGSLPKALDKLGVEVKIIIPRYGVIDKGKFNQEKISEHEVLFADQLEKFTVYKTQLPQSKVEVYLVDHPYFAGGVYLAADATPKGLDEVRRFAFLSLAALEFLKNNPDNIDIIHCHDWHTALIPTLLLTKFVNSHLSQVTTVLTIHNLGVKYQGWAKGSLLHSLDLDSGSIFKGGFLKRLKIFKKLNLLEEGIKTADFLNTVSPQYAKEVLTAEFGGKLALILNQRKDRLKGILNGLDYDIFDPTSDPNLVKNYDIKSYREGKMANKKALVKKMGLANSQFLIGMVTRLDDQKGLELVLPILPEIKKMGATIAILGRGDPKLEKGFGRFCEANPQVASCTFQFDPAMANLIYAGADMFLMPSRFEPCGLGQMIAMRYGTVPIVRDVGGLHDTVRDGETGFKFKNHDTGSLMAVVKRAKEAFENKNLWQKMIERAMKEDFSWDRSAKEYVKLYRKAIAFHKVVGGWVLRIVKITDYKDLVVWQKAMRLATEIYKLIEKFPKEETFGLVSQMRRAAVAIPSNIAEGYRRKHLGEYIQFLAISNGSAAELETQVTLAKQLNKIDSLDYTQVDSLLEEILKMLNVLISKLERRKRQGGR